MASITRVINVLDIYRDKRSHTNDHRGHNYIGCVIFRNGNIESYGYNLYDTDCWHRSIHAEENAINKLRKSKKNKKVNVLLFRLDKSYKHFLTCLPCEKCKKRLKFDIDKKGYKLNKIYCTNIDEQNNLDFVILKKNDL